MGGLFAAMAGVLAGETAPASAVTCREKPGEDGNWEKEVNMEAFYTDAVKYWEVSLQLLAVAIIFMQYAFCC